MKLAKSTSQQVRRATQRVMLSTALAMCSVASAQSRQAAAQSGVVPAPSSAQNTPTASSSPLAAAARQVARAFDKYDARTVAVLDFVNVESPEWDRVGQQLAADFRSELAAQRHAPKQEDHATILERMLAAHLSPYDLTIPSTAALVVRDSDLKLWTIAQLEPNGDFIEMNFSVVKAKKTDPPPSEIATFAVRIPFTPELKAMIDPALPDPLAAYPLAGKDGIGAPKCVKCPQAEYTDAAKNARREATILMEVVVEPNGSVGKIVVTHGAPFGLTESAVAAVQSWKLKPALDKDGHPIAVRQTVEVAFRLD